MQVVSSLFEAQLPALVAQLSFGFGFPSLLSKRAVGTKQMENKPERGIALFPLSSTSTVWTKANFFLIIRNI